jgi:Domain of unknown function (DUF1876)
MIAKRWTVEVFLSEDETGVTTARAVLHAESRHEVVGHGDARRSPQDRDIAEIGDELAAARALADLGHRLLIVASQDIAAVTGDPASLAR